MVEEESLKDKRMPDKIAAYYKTNNVIRFRQDRPFHVGERDKDCEFAVSDSFGVTNLVYNEISLSPSLSPSLPPFLPPSLPLFPSLSLSQTLWVERTTFTTSKSFPSVVTYLEVCETTSVSWN